MKRLTVFFSGPVCASVFFFCAILTPHICRAQDVTLGEIQITGKKETPPYSSYILSEDEIEKNHVNDTGELLKKVPGISGRRTGAWGLEPTLRGLKEDQINLLVDGAKAWGACPGRMDPPSSQVGPQDLEAIEVIKGPFSVRNGANGMGGVVNLITKKPKRYESPTLKGSLNMGYDSVSDGKKGKLDLYGGDKPYDYRFSFGGRKYEDYDTGDGKIIESGFKDAGYSAKLGLNPDNDKRLDMSVSQNVRKDVGHPARSMDSERARNTMTNLKYNQERISPWLSALTAQAYYSRAEHIMNNDKRASFNTMAMETDAEVTTFGGKFETVLEPGKNSSLATGADFYRLQRDADRIRLMKTGMMAGRTTEDKPWDKARIHDFGFYGELKSAPSRSWEYQAGARLDLVQANSELPSQAFLNNNRGASLQQKETNVSGNMALAYNIDEHYELTAGVGRGVRTADLSERYSNVFPSSKYLDNYDYLGNPGLEPEKSLEFDLGAGAEFERFSFKASLFYNQVDDYITGQVDPNVASVTAGARGVKRYTNVDAVLKGMELESQVKITQDLSLDADVAYTEGENRTTGAHLAQIAPLEGNLKLTYARENWWSSCSGRFVARQDKTDPTFGESETGGFATYGLAAGITPYENYSIILGVDNLLDRKYSEHLNGNDAVNGGKLLDPGRNIYVSFNWDF